MNYKVTPVIAALLAAGLFGTSGAQTPPPPAPRQSPPSDQPVEAIVDEIVREFAVERRRAALDVCTFAEQLLSVGAARITPSADGA